MNDPHVVAVYYKIVFSGHVNFMPPDIPLSASLGNFDVTISRDEIKLEPTRHFSTREEARRWADPLMSTWAVEAELRDRMPGLRFDYIRTDVIDRDPTPGVIHGHSEATLVMTGSITAILIKSLNTYPSLPTRGFATTPALETLLHRYRAHLDGREPLPATAYFIFTMLTPGERGGRVHPAAIRLNVEEKVLRTLSNLSSTRGDALTARKASEKMEPLSQQESAWLAAALPPLIVQFGIVEGGGAPSRLTQSSLPPL